MGTGRYLPHICCWEVPGSWEAASMLLRDIPVSGERTCSELASEYCSRIYIFSKKLKSWHWGGRKHSWDGSVALNSRTRGTRDPALTLGLCFSLNPKLSFYVFTDFMPWQPPRTCLAQRAAPRGLQPQSPLRGLVCGCITLPYTSSRCGNICGNSAVQLQAEFEDAGGLHK